MMSRRAIRVTAAALLPAAGLLGSAGCEADSYLAPSKLGRWEHTPATVPILEPLLPDVTMCRLNNRR